MLIVSVGNKLGISILEARTFRVEFYIELWRALVLVASPPAAPFQSALLVF